MNRSHLLRRTLSAVLAGAGLLAASCNREADPPRLPSAPSTDGFQGTIVLQTDWFPQPEHGGFYQALARGFYEEAGLQVEIWPGGPNAMTVQKVLQGKAHFSINRADAILRMSSDGLPLVMVGASLLHDPQAIMVHDSSPVRTLADLDGRVVMAVPGSSWVPFLEARYGIRLRVLPHDFGMERFLAHPDFSPQCLLTNEPFYVRQHGANPRVIPMSASGFDPYHVVYAERSWARAHSGVVRRFMDASARGWVDYIHSDPAPAHRLISGRNPVMSEEFMAFSHRTLREMGLATVTTAEGAQAGVIDPARLRRLIQQLLDLGILARPPDLDSVFFGPWREGKQPEEGQNTPFP